MNADPALATAGGMILFALSAAGSTLGTGAAASAAIGAWKKCFAQNKPAPFTLLGFVGAPMTQTLYGALLMFYINSLDAAKFLPGAGLAILIMGFFVGLAIGMSAWLQGRAGAGAADAQAETGQGMANYFGALGVIEGVAIIIVAFMFVTIGKFMAA